jgi:multiple sugar transport system permease protein
MHDSLSYRAIRAVVLVCLALFTLFPLWVLLVGSLSTATAASNVFTWLPDPVNWSSYVSMWTSVPLLHYLLNSLVVSTASMVVSVPIGVLAAYAVTRYRFRGAGAIMRVVLATQVVPGIVFLLPLFVLYASADKTIGIELDGTYFGLVLTYLTFALPFSIWLLTRYMETVPRDVEEAAMVDGASRLRAFFHTTLVMSLPGVAAVSVFTFITAWGEVLFASVLTSAQTRTLPIGLEDYESPIAGVVHWNQLMAASLTVSIPVVLGFLLVQRFVVRGLSSGAVK